MQDWHSYAKEQQEVYLARVRVFTRTHQDMGNSDFQK